nr:hypothetical protein [Tanacetum cinerariifolium]
MTLNEYLMYEGKHRELKKGYNSRISVSPKRNRILVYPDSDKEDEEYCSLPPLLLCFQTPQPCATFNFVHHNSHCEFDIDNMTLEEYMIYELAMSRAENIIKMEHEVPNSCDDITDYEDSDHEDGKLFDLLTFSATNEFSSFCEHVKGNLDVNSARELEEVQVEDIEMDDNYDIDHSNTEETLQWCLAKDPFLVCMKFNDQSCFLLQFIPSSIFNELVVLGLYLATGKHFKFRLAGYHADDNDLLELWMFLMKVVLKHGLKHAIPSSSRANPNTLHKPSGKMGLEL